MSTINVAGKRIYFAGPLFTQGEWAWNERLAAALRERGFVVVVPQEGAWPMLNGQRPFDPNFLFTVNVQGIDSADALVAIFDGVDVDSGTAWECGYAYAKGKPVIGVRTDIRAGGDSGPANVNLMLSVASREIVSAPFRNRTDLNELVEQIVSALSKI